MKAQTLLLLAGLALVCGCRRPHPTLVPEVTLPLVQEEVFSFTGPPVGNLIFPCAGGIGWVDGSSRIVTWDPEKKTAGPEIGLSFPVSAPPFRQGDFLVLQDAQADRLQVWDLRQLKVIFDVRDLKIQRVLAVDCDCLAYLDAEGVVVHSWKNPAGIFRFPDRDGTFIHGEAFPDRILLLAPSNLLTFWKKIAAFRQTPLPQPAASPFFCDGENIYYGSSQRYLLKFSTWQKRLVWKLKLGQVLLRRPFVFAGAIVAGGADHNFLLLNGRGSILWWQPLGSTLKFDLLPMSSHLAAFLLNGDVAFIDPRHRQVDMFKSTGHPLAPPLVVASDVYFLAQDGSAVTLQRIGNRYGIDIELEPIPARWLGRSVRFALQPRNLLEPAWDCVIRDAAGQQVFSKSMAAAKRVTLVWLPPQAGKYSIRVQARALNRSTENEVSFQVLDPLRLLPGFYLHF